MLIMFNCYIIVILSFLGTPTLAEFERKFVGVVFRHGDRNPLCYSLGYQYPGGVGSLTNKGKQREYELGKYIRKEYGKFLGAIYYPRLITARSSDTERTKMSLQLVMAGLFPPTKAQQWNRYINWQPVVMNYIPGARDFLLSPFDCPKYTEELEIVQKSPKVRKEMSKFNNLMKNLTEWTGNPIKNVNSTACLYTDLVSISSIGFELPKWTAGIFPNGPLEDCMILTLKILSYNQKLKKLNGGMILKNFTDTMAAIVDGDGEPDNKMLLLSAHDLNVVALLLALGVYEPSAPQYSSAVFVELLKKNHQYYVRIYYYLGIPAARKLIAIPNCDDPCAFDDFMELYRDVLPTNEEMCSLENDKFHHEL